MVFASRRHFATTPVQKRNPALRRDPHKHRFLKHTSLCDPHRPAYAHPRSAPRREIDGQGVSLLSREDHWAWQLWHGIPSRRKADSFLYVMKKLVLEQLGQRERAEAMNECAVLTKLRNHPNIVRVIEHFIDDGRLCIVMEYADGGDLAKRIEAQVASKSNFLEELVINWFVQICLALKHAHDRKILHRDLKPQNIFLTAKNSVRLGDFGISKVLSNTLSVASTCVGTPLYLAPELCEGKEYDSKSDVWSLGAILYELCALQPPFTANTMPALVMRICGNDPPPLASEISEPTRTLADRLLDKDPRQRPRVHDILKEPHIHARIEAFLNPEDLLEEFSHTIIHADPFMANGDGAARRERDPTSSRSLDAKVPAATVFGRGRGGTKPPGGIGIGGGPSAAVSRRSPGGSGATIGVRKAGAQRGMRPSSPAGEREDVSRAEDPTQRALRLREAGEKREALREQIRRDRQLKQSARRQESGEHTVFQLILGGMAKDAAAGATPAPAVPAAEQPRRGATGSDADIVEVAVGGGDAHVRLALQSAHPGTRLLTDAQRQVAQDSLARRQQEVVAQIQSSQVKGEAGRAMLNEAHRELLEIARLRSATNRPYVLVRTDPKAATNGDVIAGGGGCVVSSVPSEQIAVIDELPDDEEADLEEEIDDDVDGEALEREGRAEVNALLPNTFSSPGRSVSTVRFAWSTPLCVRALAPAAKRRRNRLHLFRKPSHGKWREMHTRRYHPLPRAAEPAVSPFM